jgi:hypothetical protein
MRADVARWVLSVVAAWASAYAVYFGLVGLLDTVAGGRQLLSDLLFRSERALLGEFLGVLVDSAGVALPVVLVCTVITLAGPGGRAWRASAARALACAAAVGVGLLGYGMAVVHAATFALALLAAGLAVLAVYRACER